MSDDDAFVDWMMADSWQDYRQQRAIRTLGNELDVLGASLSAQRRESGRLRSELAKLQGTLEERVSRLSRAFDAFVELSDLRMTLAMFDPPALIRHRTRQILADPSGAASAGDFADVPGYWLGPAVRAYVAVLAGDDHPATLGEALERDPVRSALFLTVATALTDRAELSERWLPRALGELTPDEPLTHAQRVLWTAAAEGTFGPGGRALLEQHLVDLVKGLPPERETAMAKAWHAAAGADTNDPIPAAAALGRLRALCEKTVEPTSSGAVLGEMLRSLVDEGSDEEAPLIRRAGELRAVIENRAEPTTVAWDAPASTAAELLLTDAFAADAGSRGAVARAAGARWIVAAAERLAERAATTPPDQSSITVSGVAVTVLPNSENAMALALVRAEVERRYPPPSSAAWPTVGLAGFGFLLGLTAFAVPAGGLAVFAVLAGIGLLIGAGVRWRRTRRAVEERRVSREGGLRHAERQIERASADLRSLRERMSRAANQATEDLAAIRARL